MSLYCIYICVSIYMYVYIFSAFFSFFSHYNIFSTNFSALSLINQPSRDPSMPLPWWDKMRLLFHGRLTLMVERMTLLLHASLDPYNTTEEMELTWTSLTMDWTNGKPLSFMGGTFSLLFPLSFSLLLSGSFPYGFLLFLCELETMFFCHCNLPCLYQVWLYVCALFFLYLFQQNWYSREIWKSR